MSCGFCLSQYYYEVLDLDVLNVFQSFVVTILFCLKMVIFAAWGTHFKLASESFWCDPGCLWWLPCLLVRQGVPDSGHITICPQAWKQCFSRGVWFFFLEGRGAPYFSVNIDCSIFQQTEPRNKFFQKKHTIRLFCYCQFKLSIKGFLHNLFTFILLSFSSLPLKILVSNDIKQLDICFSLPNLIAFE